MNFVADFFTILQPVIVLVLIAHLVNIVLQIVVSAFRGGY